MNFHTFEQMIPMSDYILKVPDSNHARVLMDFISNSNKIVKKGSTVIIDFNDVNFLHTHHFVALACLVENFFINDCLIKFRGGTNNFNSHLDNIKFKNYWSEGFDRERFTISLNKSTLCLWKICENMIWTYSEYAKKYFRETFLNDKDLLPLSSNLQEVFRNIFDHAKSIVSGYVITQYHPQKHLLSFSVCDFGIGIPSSINQYLRNSNQEILKDNEAILKSLEKGFTIKSTQRNRGFGLDNILSFVESHNGKMSIISNRGYVMKIHNQIIKSGSFPVDFKGTLISVYVNTNEFENIDLEDEIFDF